MICLHKNKGFTMRIRQTVTRSDLRLLISALVFGFLVSCAATDSKNGTASSIADSREIRQLAVQASEAYERDDVASAELLYQEMMAHNPRSPDVLNSYAIFLREQWRLEEAERVYHRALRFSPDSVMTHWNIAVLYDLYLGDPRKALDHYEAYKRIAEKPDRRVHSWVVDLQHRIKQKAVAEDVKEVAGND